VSYTKKRRYIYNKLRAEIIRLHHDIPVAGVRAHSVRHQSHFNVVEKAS